MQPATMLVRLESSMTTMQSISSNTGLNGFLDDEINDWEIK